MTEMFGEAWSPMSVPDLAPDDDDDSAHIKGYFFLPSLEPTEFKNYIDKQTYMLSYFLPERTQTYTRELRHFF